jgi:hypothetical protein
MAAIRANFVKFIEGGESPRLKHSSPQLARGIGGPSSAGRVILPTKALGNNLSCGGAEPTAFLAAHHGILRTLDSDNGILYPVAVLDLSDNLYNRSLSRDEPKFKLWRSAGLMLTYRCNATCAFCYYHCSPRKGGLMPVETCLAAWRSLKVLAGDEARVHLTGGEPFLYPEHLFAILKEGKERGLGPVDLVETNGFWATDDRRVKDWLGILLASDVRRLKISVDPFHQEYVDIEPVRRLAAIAKERFGPERVLVRWEKYLADFKSQISNCRLPAERDRIYVDAYREYPFRLTGRAAGHLAQLIIDNGLWMIKKESSDSASHHQSSFINHPCLSGFLGAKGVHIDPYGNVFNGTCSGIILGNVNQTPLDEMWRAFHPRQNGLIQLLCESGPGGLLEKAETLGYAALSAYAGKCHLCTHLRQFLFEKHAEPSVLGPADCYA